MGVPGNDVKIYLDRDAERPMYLQIADGLTNHIRSGRLRRGQQLPATRQFAEDLGVHRRTLQLALDELAAQGWLDIVPKQGVYVAKDFPELKLLKFLAQPQQFPDKTNFTIRKSPVVFPTSDYQVNDKLIMAEGYPDIRLAPVEELFRELRSIANMTVMKKHFRYGNPQGSAYLRETLASFLSETRGIMARPDQIIITRGAQMAIFLSARTILSKGDHIIVGDPGYVTATLTFQQTGAIVHKVPVDENGIDVDEIERLCRKQKIKMVYVIPHHHHPTTVSLPIERRARLLNLAARYHFAVVEDDYDYDFHFSGSPKMPMASFDQLGNVVYIGTLSKTLASSLRIGFLVAPRNFITEAVKIRRFMDFQGDSFLEVAIAELYKTGLIERHIKKVTKIYKERRDHLCALLKEHLKEDVSFNVPEGGLAVWTKFLAADIADVCSKASEKGLLFLDGTIYNTRHSANATRLGFSSLNFVEQEKAVEILREAVIRSKQAKGRAADI